MSKKKLTILIAGVLVVLVPTIFYVRTTYVWAQNSLKRAQLEIRTLGERIDRHDPVSTLKEAYNRAQFQADQVAKHHSMWIKGDEITALRKSLEEYKHDLDQIGVQK